MRRIVHLSDVHFGDADRRVVDRVVTCVNELKPDITVVSGDLTQRARTSEFIAAREFLDRLPEPQIVVPGNHDVPVYNFLERFVHPLKKYKRYITNELQPVFRDEEMILIGVNTARSMVIKGGRINREQVAEIEGQFCDIDDSILKVVVTHHPFDLPEDSHHAEVVGRAAKAMAGIAACGGDLFLAGHLHTSHIETTAKRYKLEGGGNALVVQAGTATSARVRGEPHSFNLIVSDGLKLEVQRFESSAATEEFRSVLTKRYTKAGRGWHRDE